jgi:hypothetical protein
MAWIIPRGHGRSQVRCALNLGASSAVIQALAATRTRRWVMEEGLLVALSPLAEPILNWSTEGRPAHGASETDRGCSLRARIDPSMWHTNGTTGENEGGPHMAATAPSSAGG